jgi:hypothetical protein
MTWTTDNRWNTGSLVVPDGAVAAYGGRWIDQGDYARADIVPDRHGFAYDWDADRDELVKLLAEHDPAAWVSALPRDEITRRDYGGGLHIAVRRAGGYFYVAAWIT